MHYGGNIWEKVHDLHVTCYTDQPLLSIDLMLIKFIWCMKNDPKWHLIDCKILLSNCFSLPCTEKENLTWDQDSLKAFVHGPL